MIPCLEPDHILELNRDLEPFIIQGSVGRSRFWGDAYKPLQFVHLSDIHTRSDLWNRMVDFVNHYQNFISFALHTGDYCGASQLSYNDLYAMQEVPCARPILNCVGNHDCEANSDWAKGTPCFATQESVHRLLFNHTEDWGVTFMPGETPTSYYQDFPEANIRLIVLDLYNEIEAHKAWLKGLLNEAKEKGLHVITAMHQMSAGLSTVPESTFTTYHDYEARFGKKGKTVYEDTIAEFIAGGGIHVCNLAGHEHRDYFGITAGGVLNVTVECATAWHDWSDGVRIPGSRTFDCFNVVSVDVNVGMLKLLRVGNNCDHLLRAKRALCYDYMNKKVVFNG